MQENIQQEELSKAYLHVTAAAAGCNVSYSQQDLDSIDCTLSSTISGRVFDSPKIDFQLKTTRVNSSRMDGDIYFDIPKKNFDDLKKNSASPRLLLLLLVPEEIPDWVRGSHGELVVKYAAYWYCLKTLPDSDNTTSVRLHIPRKNIFTVDVLKDLMQRHANGEEIK